MTFELILDHLPYSQLNQNNLRRTHWTVRSKWEKVARQEAYLLALENQEAWVMPEGMATIYYEFIVANKRRRDIDGLLGACKPFLDGLVDAGILRDDDWQHLKIGGAKIILGKQEQTRIGIHY